MLKILTIISASCCLVAAALAANFFPVDESLLGEELEVVVMGMQGGGHVLEPSIWLNARGLPFRTAE